MSTATLPPVRTRLIRSTEREHHRADGLLGRFSFPFTGNFDLTQHAHGALLVHNDDIISPRSGVDPHRHQEMEILTGIVDGRVVHEDTAGHRAELTAGMLQRMSAGTGVLHSEQNADPTADARVVQMWVPPGTAAVRPSYEQVDLNAALCDGGVVTAASGRERSQPSASRTHG